MKRLAASAVVPAAIFFALSAPSPAIAAGAASAAGPKTSECLAASDASSKLATQNKLRAERTQLLVCASASCPADIRKDCVSHVDEVSAQIPTIIFAAKNGAGADLTAVKVTMDGELLTDQLQGTAIAVDPGDHTFVFATAGETTITKTFLVQQSQKERREVITFGTSVAPEPAVLSPNGQTAPPVSPAAEPVPARTGLGTQKTLAIVSGGVGVVGVILGGVFGGVAASKKSSAKDLCPTEMCATQEGVDKWSSAKSAGNVSTIGFIVGGVGLAGAAVLWFTAPKSGSDASTQVGFGPGNLLVKGTF